MTKIAIIGGGLSGRLVVLHLLRSGLFVDCITIFEREDAGHMGPAYLDDADNFLLNVPVTRMGALSEDPEHFLKWVRSKGIGAEAWDVSFAICCATGRSSAAACRLPPQTITVIEAMRASCRLEVIAGRIRELVETEAGLEVHYLARGEATARMRLADLVINCIGPESDYRKVDHVLITNLMRRGLIRPGPANLGIDCLPNGAILDSAGIPSVLYTLGSTMKGVLWEVLAVPDIRGRRNG